MASLSTIDVAFESGDQICPIKFIANGKYAGDDSIPTIVDTLL